MPRNNQQQQQPDEDPNRLSKLYIIVGIAGIAQHMADHPELVSQIKAKTETHTPETKSSEEG